MKWHDLTSSPHDDFIKLRKHLDEFIRLYLVIGVNIDKKDQVILLLSSLPKVYEHFVDTILYGNDTFTMNEVRVALSSKELQIKSDSKYMGFYRRMTYSWRKDIKKRQQERKIL